MKNYKSNKTSANQEISQIKNREVPNSNIVNHATKD
jgi:hypothetical protein